MDLIFNKATIHRATADISDVELFVLPAISFFLYFSRTPQCVCVHTIVPEIPRHMTSSHETSELSVDAETRIN